MAMDHQHNKRMSDSQASNAAKRRRVPEACHACRKRKAKCDGLRPCSFCKANNVDCVFDAQMVPLGTVEQSLLYLPESMKQLSERVSHIEQYLRDASERDRMGRLSPRFRETRHDSLADSDGSKVDQHMIEPGGDGVTAVANADESRATEYYGATSTVAIASDLYQAATSPVATQRSVTSPPAGRRMDELSGIDALLNPAVDPTEDYTSRRPVSSKLDDPANKPIADRHLANFFETIHTLIPVLHEGAFRALYDAFWIRVANEPASHAESHIRKITAPLVYSVLALGALYEDGYNDNAGWAKEWFAKARDCVNNAVEEGCFEMCLGVYFLSSYSQHVIKPNLAYNFLGVAIRLAYSIGLNRSSVAVSYDETAWPGVGKVVIAEMCKRIWWQMYTLEVEIALDSGRPICIRNSDIDVEWPVECDDKEVKIDTKAVVVAKNGPSKVSYLAALSRFSRIIRRVLKLLFPVKKKSLSLPSITESLVELDKLFCEWRDSLPPHLNFAQPVSNLGEARWITRARVAIICHFNHIYIVMHRPLLTVPRFSTPFLSSEASHEIGINAAKENISLIHSALQHDTGLRKWVYYSYYNFMAELVFLTMLVKQPFSEEAREWAALCNMAIESFEWMMPLAAAKKSRTMSKTFVDEWKAKVESAIDANGVKRKRSFNPEHQRLPSHNQIPVATTPSTHINYLLQPPQNAYPQTFVSPTDFGTPIHVSPQGSDSSYSPMNAMLQQSNPSSMQTLDAAAAETLQSFSGTGWPNQGIFAGDGAMGWLYNFEDLFGDLSGSPMGGGQQRM